MTPYYDRDGITIWHGRCEDILPSIDPAMVDLLLTDPPYGISANLDYGRFTSGKTYGVAIEGDSAPFDPLPLLRFPRTCIFGANHFATSLPPRGQWIVWMKRGASPLLAAAELAWHNLGGRSVDYFESTVKGMKVQEGAVHPTQKPSSLMRWIVEKHTEPGDLILDPYMGSGPVAQACHELGRRYVGIELVEDYCRVAVSRLAQQTLDLEGMA